MKYFITTTIGESKIKSEPFESLVEAQRAKEKLDEVVRINHFSFEWKIEVEGLFLDYQNSLITLPSLIPNTDENTWLEIYKNLKNSILADIIGDYHAGWLTDEEYEKLMKINKLLEEF